MDKYSKFIFTVIAICLIAIVVKLWEPTPAYSGFLDTGPTIGDLMDLRNMDTAKRKEASTNLVRRIPLVRIHGSVDVDID